MMKYKSLKSKFLSYVLAAAVFCTAISAQVFADEIIDISDSEGTIEEFRALEEPFVPLPSSNYEYLLTVEPNTTFDDLNLPDELTALVARATIDQSEDESDIGKASASDAEEEENETVDGVANTVETENFTVTWKGDKEYTSDIPEEFVFTAELTGNYTLAEHVELPKIYVRVGSLMRMTISDTIYVSADGNDNSGNGTKENPYQTISQAVDYASAGSTIVLLSDLECVKKVNATPPSSIVLNKNVTIKSENGHAYTIHRQSDGYSLFNVSSKAKVRFENIILTGNGKASEEKNDFIIIGSGSELTLGAGASVEDVGVKRWEGAGIGWKYGFAVILNEGTLIMEDGSALRNLTGGAGCIRLGSGGRFTMEGGLIENCDSIYENEANVVYVSDSSSFIMNGGLITGSSQTTSYGTVFLSRDGANTFSMTGGEISGNKSKLGGGLYVAGNGKNKVTLSGDVIISGNTKADGSDSNVYLLDNQVLTIGSNGMGDNSDVGIYVQSPPTSAGQKVEFAVNAKEDDAAKFFSDNSENAGVVFDTSSLYLSYDAKGSSTARLSVLSLSNGDLSPVFSENVLSYEAAVDYSVDSVTLTPTVKTEGDTVKVNNVSVISGTPSNGISLNVGKNVILVTVSAATGSLTRKYTVTITRGENPNKTYTITFDANGGSVSPASAVTEGEGRLTSLPVPARSGAYRFDGWFTEKEGGTQVTVDTLYTENSTIYAHWTNISTGGGKSSSDSGVRSSLPAGYRGGTKLINNILVPDYTIEGAWIKHSDGSWSFTAKEENNPATGWKPVYNPYANFPHGQNAFDWFLFDANGIMMTGWYKEQDGSTYYLNPYSDNTLGAMQTGWVLIDGKYYYFNETSDGTRGRMLRDMKTSDGYYVDSNGVCSEKN